MSSVISLFDLSRDVSVRHVNLLAAHTEAIPPVLYESLLEAAMKTDRILSVRHLFLSWPLQKLSLANCKEFKEHHALVLAHSLESGCKMLRVVDLTGCNIGNRSVNVEGRLACRIKPELVWNGLRAYSSPSSPKPFCTHSAGLRTRTSSKSRFSKFRVRF